MNLTSPYNVVDNNSSLGQILYKCLSKSFSPLLTITSPHHCSSPLLPTSAPPPLLLYHCSFSVCLCKPRHACHLLIFVYFNLQSEKIAPQEDSMDQKTIRRRQHQGLRECQKSGGGKPPRVFDTPSSPDAVFFEWFFDPCCLLACEIRKSPKSGVQNTGAIFSDPGLPTIPNDIVFHRG